MQHTREQITAENKIKDRGQGGESKIKRKEKDRKHQRANDSSGKEGNSTYA